MSSTTVMKAKAKLIKEETQEGANTAARVGGLFEDIVDYLDSADPTSSLKITPYVTTGTRIARFSVGGEETTIFAPSNGGSGGGSTYDDTEIREIINELDKALDNTTALANSEKDRLDGVIADIDENVKEKMQDAVEFAEWVQGNFPQGETGYQSGWNEKTKQFMQVVGMWDTSTDNPAVTTTKWSKLTQDVDDLYAEVTSISTGGEVTKDMVQSWIGTSVQNKIAELNLGTTYATQDDTGEILKWLYSALKGSTSEYETYNQFVSAARNGASTAISELRTYVEQLKDGTFVATADIETKVNDAITGLYSKATADDATTTIFSQVKKDSADIAALVVGITDGTSTIDLATRIANWKAGLVTTANKSGSIASLLAANSDNTAAAAIAAIVNSNGSTAKISADHIELTGITTVYDTNGDAIVTCDTNGIHMGYLTGTGHQKLDISEGVITSSELTSSHESKKWGLGYDGLSLWSYNDTGSGYPYELKITDKSIRIIHNISTSVDDVVFSVITTPQTYVTDLFINHDITAGHNVTCDNAIARYSLLIGSSSAETTYTDTGITSQGTFTIGPASFNSSSLALSTAPLTFGNFQIKNVTLSGNTYLSLSPIGDYSSGILLSADGTIGANINGVFYKGYSLSDTSDLYGFLHSAGSSTVNQYTIKDGLIVEIPTN